MKIKNIVIINDFDYTQGGASKVAIETANLLVENKDLNIYYFSATSSKQSELNDRIIKVSTNQPEAIKDRIRIRGFFNGIYNFKAKRELKKLLKTLDREETIIHIHGWTKSLSSSIFSPIFKLRYKNVLTLHDYFTACPNGGYFNYNRTEICSLKPCSFQCIKCNCDSRNYFIKLYRVLRQFVQNKIVKLNDRLTNVITVSDFSQMILKRTLNENVNIYRINNPIDLDTNRKPVDYRQNDYFLYVGRVSKEKGVDLFCEAITKTNQKGIVVGDGPDLDYLKKNYPNLDYVGWKSSTEVKEYMKNAKALIFPSKLYECAPLTPYEAMQYGIPIIVNACCAARDNVNDNDNKNGVTFKDLDDLNKIINMFDVYQFNVNTQIENKYYESILELYKNI